MSRVFVNQDENFVCECGRVFSKSQLYYAHLGHCKAHLGDRYNESMHGDRIGDKRAWAKGKTKNN